MSRKTVASPGKSQIAYNHRMTSLNSASASVRQTSLGSRPLARPTQESTAGRLAIAQKLLLEPFGLSDAVLSRALGEITSYGVDDADLYFQYTRSEGWSLEEGIVKTGSFSIDQGVGVRAVSGEKTAFAYSDDISEASLLDAARTVRSISAASKAGRVKTPARKIATSRSLYQGLDPIATLGSTAKVNCLKRSKSSPRPKTRASCR